VYKLNFNHLYYFLTIAKEGSIVKASKILNITQPALSHQLKALETDLDKELFDRKGKRLVLNANGEQVKAYAEKIFRNSEEMMESLSESSSSYVKIIKVGTVSWVSKDHIYKILQPLIFNHHIKVQVYQKDLETLLREVSSGDLDLILCDAPYTGRSKKLQAHRLIKDQIICVSASKNDFKGGFPKCLNGKRMISYPETSLLSNDLDSFLMNNNLKIENVGEFADASLIRVAIENGRLFGFLPSTVAKRSLKEKALVKLGVVDKSTFNLWGITKKKLSKDSIVIKTIKNIQKKQVRK
jgi:LysR family transcriptional activator of nhaA